MTGRFHSRSLYPGLSGSSSVLSSLRVLTILTWPALLLTSQEAACFYSWLFGQDKVLPGFSFSLISVPAYSDQGYWGSCYSSVQTKSARADKDDAIGTGDAAQWWSTVSYRAGSWNMR